MEAVTDFSFLDFKVTVDSVCSHEIKRLLLPGGKALTNLDSIWKSKDIILMKVPYSQSYGFSSSHVQMWELDPKDGWVLKDWFFWIVVLEKTLESLLAHKEIKPVNPKGNQSWICIGRTDAEASILWLWCEELTHWKRPWCWKSLKAKGEGVKLVRQHHQLNVSKLWEMWRTGEPGVLQSMGSQRVIHDLATELQQLFHILSHVISIALAH